jgi:hypothetical protein
VEVQATPREVEVNDQRRIDMLYHFTAVGTAIAPADGGHRGALPVESIVPL